MFTQLTTPLPVHACGKGVCGKGAARAFAVIDYGQEHDLMWVTAMDAGGAIWCVPNGRIRMAANWSLGRAKDGAGDAGTPPPAPV